MARPHASTMNLWDDLAEKHNVSTDKLEEMLRLFIGRSNGAFEQVFNSLADKCPVCHTMFVFEDYNENPVPNDVRTV
jgi:hypothetical protein